MTTEQIIWMMLSSLLSGFVGVGISTIYYRRHEVRKSKLDTLKSFMGYRFDVKGTEFTKALNEVAIVFSDSSNVKKALSEYHVSIGTNQTEDRLVKLFKSMCSELNLGTSEFNDSFFLTPFNLVTKANENLERCHQIFKTLMATRAAVVSSEHVNALNMINIEFPDKDYPKVIKAWKIYFGHLHDFPDDHIDQQQLWKNEANKLLCDLLKEMGDSLGYNFDVVDISKGIYSPRAHGTFEAEQQLLRDGMLKLLQGNTTLRAEITNLPKQDEYIGEEHLSKQSS